MRTATEPAATLTSPITTVTTVTAFTTASLSASTLAASSIASSAPFSSYKLCCRSIPAERHVCTMRRRDVLDRRDGNVLRFVRTRQFCQHDGYVAVLHVRIRHVRGQFWKRLVHGVPCGLDGPFKLDGMHLRPAFTAPAFTSNSSIATSTIASSAFATPPCTAFAATAFSSSTVTAFAATAFAATSFSSSSVTPVATATFAAPSISIATITTVASSAKTAAREERGLWRAASVDAEAPLVAAGARRHGRARLGAHAPRAAPRRPQVR